MKKREGIQKMRKEGNQETIYGRNKWKQSGNNEIGKDGREDGMIRRKWE